MKEEKINRKRKRQSFTAAVMMIASSLGLSLGSVPTTEAGMFSDFSSSVKVILDKNDVKGRVTARGSMGEIEAGAESYEFYANKPKLEVYQWKDYKGKTRISASVKIPLGKLGNVRVGF